MCLAGIAKLWVTLVHSEKVKHHCINTVTAVSTGHSFSFACTRQKRGTTLYKLESSAETGIKISLTFIFAQLHTSQMHIFEVTVFIIINYERETTIGAFHTVEGGEGETVEKHLWSCCISQCERLPCIKHTRLFNLFLFYHVRLLKVKPEERLTIEGVLAHPWLNCTEALDNVLPSAQMMMDKVWNKWSINRLYTKTFYKKGM